MSARTARLILTAGEPAGIGPDICLKIAAEKWPAALAVAADPALLAERNKRLGCKIHLLEQDPDAQPQPHEAGILPVVPLSSRGKIACGKPNPENASYVLETIDHATDACLAGRYDAMVTGPVQKSVLLDAGFDFTGHTEYIAKRTGTGTPVMLLISGSMRVALVTTHLPLKEVAGAVTPDRLRAVLEVLHRDLRRLFGIEAPRIRVLGLNPHAGESGHLGQEEMRVIEPVLDLLRQGGMKLDGPLAADTAFDADRPEGTDAIVAMYHDQGLPVLKYAGFGKAVNVTLGLPIIRTSVDHGTALALAGTGKADPGSLRQTIATTLDIVSNSRG